MKRIALAVIVIVLVILACSKATSSDRPQLILEYSPTPTDTVAVTQTPIVKIIEITNTPVPTIASTINLCVNAVEAVYLRPSPSTTYYPLKPLENGTRVVYRGTYNGDWKFVEVGDNAGWVKGEFLGDCGG